MNDVQDSNINPIFFSNWWEMFPCSIDGIIHAIRFDTAVRSLDEETKLRFPHTFVMSFQYDADEKGHPLPSERERIYSIEDNFTCGKYEIRLMGIITGGGVVRFAFCCNCEIGIDEKGILQQLLGNRYADLDCAYELRPNDNFAYYNGAIAPNIYEYNWIMDRQVCANMEKDGEVLKTPRDVDFFWNFESELHIQSVSEKMQVQGFIEQNRSKTEQGDYSLHMTLNGIPSHGWVNNAVANILDALENTDGMFDGWGSEIRKE
jgi:hypothetical protein